MRYLRCKCGKKEMWDSGYPVHDCQGCDKCKTTFAETEDGHRTLQPHIWDDHEEVKKVNGMVVEQKKYEKCSFCGEIKSI